MMWLGFIILLSLSIGWSNAVCPPPGVMRPCECKQVTDHYGTGDRILCFGRQHLHLPSTFKRISANRKSDEQHFYKLVVRNTAIEEIESDAIGNLTFDYISIFDCIKLTKIHSLAFKNSAKQVKHFELSYSPKLSLLPAPHNLFQMLNSFANVKSIVIYNISITHLSGEVFKSLASLNRLTLARNDIPSPEQRLTVANRAFYNLNNLTHLTLAKYHIDSLPSNSIYFRRNSNQTLSLNLHDNKLNSSSFSTGWLNFINRRVDVDLSSNRVTFLDQDVFQPFLDTRKSRIGNLERNPLNCTDCRNAWLGKEQAKYKSRVDRAYCNGKQNGPTIFDQKFDHC